METPAHRRLKRLAIAFVRSRGGLAVAAEVRCPIGRYRLDVAGYQDTDPEALSHPRRCPARTIIVECKQSRADFVRHGASTEPLLRRREALHRIRRSIEEHRIKPEEPQLRRSGSALFPELEDWDFHASRLPAYRKVLRTLDRVDQRLHGHTKFHRIATYRLADRLYIAAPRGLVRRCELPVGWGLLECPREWLDGDAHRDRLDEPPMLDESVAAPEQEADPERRVRLLRNIAVAASFAAARQRRPAS
ncbi:MAG: hypothetical protein ACYTGG_09030 [Planctomycetota bacterium]|jgi:hypothetical protein